jgi:N utilization substance protein B
MNRPATARRRAREVLFRIVYQADVTGDPLARVWDERRAEERLSEDQESLVADVIGAIAGRAAEVDAEIERAAEHWRLDRLAATDRSVLRAAVGEVMARPGTPVRVILDEAIELAKRYGSDESGRFVNGVLDRVARALRATEIG